jgi:hypothetical protein
MASYGQVEKWIVSSFVNGANTVYNISVQIVANDSGVAGTNLDLDYNTNGTQYGIPNIVASDVASQTIPLIFTNPSDNSDSALYFPQNQTSPDYAKEKYNGIWYVGPTVYRMNINQSNTKPACITIINKTKDQLSASSAFKIVIYGNTFTIPASSIRYLTGSGTSWTLSTTPCVDNQVEEWNILPGGSMQVVTSTWPVIGNRTVTYLNPVGFTGVYVISGEKWNGLYTTNNFVCPVNGNFPFNIQDLNSWQNPTSGGSSVPYGPLSLLRISGDQFFCIKISDMTGNNQDISINFFTTSYTLPANGSIFIQGNITSTSTTANPAPNNDRQAVTVNVIFPAVCCLHPDTLIQTIDGVKSISSIKSGDIVVKGNGETTQVLFNIKYYVPTKKFIKISRGAFGQDLPINDIFITEGHPLMIDEKEIECEKLLNGHTITKVELDEPINVYAICCDKRNDIMTEGIPIMTWEPIEWETFYKKNKIIWSKANDSDNGFKV